MFSRSRSPGCRVACALRPGDPVRTAGRVSHFERVSESWSNGRWRQESWREPWRRPCSRRRRAAGQRAAGGVYGATVGLRGQGVREAPRFSPRNAFAVSPALTYDMKLVPAGARIEVVRRGGRGRVSVSVRGEGPAAGRACGAHVQQGECGGIRPWWAGTYRRREDPVQPSTGPAHANPENEVWLGFTTDAHGAGAATARQSWEFRPGEAWSVVLRRRPGGAGARDRVLHGAVRSGGVRTGGIRAGVGRADAVRAGAGRVDGGQVAGSPRELSGGRGGGAGARCAPVPPSSGHGIRPRRAPAPRRTPRRPGAPCSRRGR